jgi:hypothetical protein
MILSQPLVDSLLKNAKINVDLATPTEIGATLKATYVVAMVVREYRKRVFMSVRLYDIQARKLVIALRDSSPVNPLDVRTMAAMLALNQELHLLPTITADQADHYRDSVLQDLVTQETARRAAIARNEVVRRLRRSFVRAAVRHYDRTIHISAAVAAGMFLGGIFFNSSADGHFRKAISYHDDYLKVGQDFGIYWAKASGEYAKGRQALKVRNIFYAVAASTAGVAATVGVMRIIKARRLAINYDGGRSAVTTTITIARW